MKVGTQNGRVLHALRLGGCLTPQWAWQKMGIMRLGARIHDLRQQGWPIKTRLVVRGRTRYAEYRMAAGEKP